MIKNKNRSNQGIAVQIVVGLVFLVVSLLLYVLFEPLFSQLDTSANSQLNGTRYEDDSSNLLTFLSVLSGTGLLVLPVIIFTVFVIGRAIYLTQFQ